MAANNLAESPSPKNNSHPDVVAVRRRVDATAAVVFVHGFCGAAGDTWGNFPRFLAAEPALNTSDILSFGYPTSLRVDIPNLWSADPPLARLSLSLRTALQVPPLAQYAAISLVAHSMGGLVAQHALLDRAAARRVVSVTLFGTPSRGLYKAVLGLPFKRQARDMLPWSPFMLALRWRWWRQFGRRCPFDICIVAGERDEFVPPRSSLSRFPKEVQRVVPGNHLEIVKPLTRDDRSVQLVIATLTGTETQPSRVDSALLLIERREFHQAVEQLRPFAGDLDDVGVVALALALDGIGSQGEALDILEQYHARGGMSSDARGVLAGRLKRRWLAARRRVDWERSRDLYVSALYAAESADDLTGGDHEQAMYHAINVAFLDLMAAPLSSALPASVRDMANRAREHAEAVTASHWQQAVLGDAACILGDLAAARVHYTHARALAERPREIDSMYAQAIRIAARVHGAEGARRIEECFHLGPQAPD